jgi:hypothetical protein
MGSEGWVPGVEIRRPIVRDGAPDRPPAASRADLSNRPVGDAVSPRDARNRA